jgi:hypothetical protein
VNLDSIDLERDGAECLAEMEQACRAHRPAALREAVENAGNFLLLARMDLPTGAHEPDVVVRVASRLRTLQFAAA